jgi:hypothetical protein
MTPASDPYRTLGLARGASLEEVKRAYRALAKKHHPDAAGPTALPRWLAIQAAYEQLVHGTNPARTRATPPGPGSADPDRADATHRAYGGRARRTRATSGADGTGSRPTGSSGPGSRTGSSGTSGSTGATGAKAGQNPSGESPRGGRGRNKATLGSTSYDGADAGPFEPDWGGASWDGTTSGTYWTINPKEYADPRKHGPEYQARARRAAAAAGRRAGTGDGGTPDGPSPPIAAPEAPGPSAEAREPDEPAPTHTTSSWWRSTAGPAGAPPEAAPASERPSARPSGGGRPSAAANPSDAPPPDLAAAATDLGRALTDERTARGRWRLIQVVVGWLPIVIGADWLVGELTGCGRFAATCDGGAWALTPILAVAAFAVLLLAPRLAALAAAGAIAIIVAAVPTTLLLSATGSAATAEARNATLGVVVVIAWVVGLVIGLARQMRPVGVPSDRAGPVS